MDVRLYKEKGLSMYGMGERGVGWVDGRIVYYFMRILGEEDVCKFLCVRL